MTLERNIQKTFVKEVLRRGQTDPRYLNGTAVPNGAHLAGGARGFNSLKGQGVSAGYPDWLFDYPSGPFNGLRIEFKQPGKKPTPEQEVWHKRLRDAGYVVEVCTSAEDALVLLETYLDCGLSL